MHAMSTLTRNKQIWRQCYCLQLVLGLSAALSIFFTFGGAIFCRNIIVLIHYTTKKGYILYIDQRSKLTIKLLNKHIADKLSGPWSETWDLGGSVLFSVPVDRGERKTRKSGIIELFSSHV